MNYPSIKLNKKHIPLHPKLTLNDQSGYDYYINMLLYLENQLELGFNPKWMITFHYYHPSEQVKPIKETNKPLGYGDRYSFKSYVDLFKEVPFYKYLEGRRNEIDGVYNDAGQIRNSVLKTIYGIKRLNRTDKYEFPNLFFFHEKGKVKLQYHTHLLLTEKNILFDTIEDLKDVFNTTIRKSRKCFLKWKDIDIKPITDAKGAIGYLNKESNNINHLSFDPFNSIPIIPMK